VALCAKAPRRKAFVAGTNAFTVSALLLLTCSVFAGEQHAIPAVSACNTRASIPPCESGVGHAFQSFPQDQISDAFGVAAIVDFRFYGTIRPSIILLRQSRNEPPENLPKSGDFTAFLKLESAICACGELPDEQARFLQNSTVFKRIRIRRRTFPPLGSSLFSDPRSQNQLSGRKEEKKKHQFH